MLSKENMDKVYLFSIIKLIDELADCVIDAALNIELYKPKLSERDVKLSIHGLLNYGFIDVKDLYLLDTRELLLKFISKTEDDVKEEPAGYNNSTILSRSYQFENFFFSRMIEYITEYKNILVDLLYFDPEFACEATNKSGIIIEAMHNISYITECKTLKDMCTKYKGDILNCLENHYKEINMELKLTKKEFSEDEKNRNKLIEGKIYIVECILDEVLGGY